MCTRRHPAHPVPVLILVLASSQGDKNFCGRKVRARDAGSPYVANAVHENAAGNALPCHANALLYTKSTSTCYCITYIYIAVPFITLFRVLLPPAP